MIEKKTHQLLFCGYDKRILLDKCCLCRNTVITNHCDCLLQLPMDDDCPKFANVDDVAIRIKELATKLPNGYDGFVYLKTHVQ